jgi:hypothetical protein
MLVQPEAALSLSLLTDRGRRKGHNTEFLPAHERRHGRTNALVFFIFSWLLQIERHTPTHTSAAPAVLHGDLPAGH